MVINLKTETKEQMLNALESAGFEFFNGELVTATHDYFIHLIGDIYTPTGATMTDDDGNEYPETAIVDGYHANLVTQDVELIDGVSSITITVSTPSYTVAGY